MTDQERSTTSSSAKSPSKRLVDLLPTPAVSDPTKTDQAEILSDKPTLSHALAMDNHAAEKGLAQQAFQRQHEKDIMDLGWNESEDEIADPLVGGLENEELWLLVRRFNKQVYHVKSSQHPVPGNLDMYIADEENFSPDKLRASIERLYMTIIVGILAAWKHITRIRSWRERRRTACFCFAYYAAWAFDMLVPLHGLTLIGLILFPPLREMMFPPAPMALVDAKTGNLQKPEAGLLGSYDSVTGASENYKGEAVEQEARNFVNSIASIALSSASGKHSEKDSHSDSEDGSPQDATPDPTAIAVGAADAKSKASGAVPAADYDKTKVPMDTMLWRNMRPTMFIIVSLTDAWERVANALSPTPPFPSDTYRLRLAALVVPPLAVSLFFSSYMFAKTVTFGIGLLFFGQPIISRAVCRLNRKYPHWQRILELRNTVLKGVPTNAQLTITLLRIGEANHAPLPPPPRSTSPPPLEPAALTPAHLRATGDDTPLNASPEELASAISPDPAAPDDNATTGAADVDAAKAPRHGRRGSRLLGFFKGTTKTVVETTLSADKVKAKTGSMRAKDRLGAVPPSGPEHRRSGPVAFKARYRGRKGFVVLKPQSDMQGPGPAPVVGFVLGKDAAAACEAEGVGGGESGLKASWSLPVSRVDELRKVGGFGWKAKLVVGWALEREVADGLEIVERETGARWKVTACPRRDELFNRLVAVGGQRWVSM
ncbi:hypothetical protein IWX90DRAFT_464831 [Phyllosticta citrichinensis]|uniref:Uncharacterized protein n=1 Tax=Phyllosticta citrichinensis TaxID=1130410 RepID=A0ABR1XZC5_9PEZI